MSNVISQPPPPTVSLSDAMKIVGKVKSVDDDPAVAAAVEDVRQAERYVGEVRNKLRPIQEEIRQLDALVRALKRDLQRFSPELSTGACKGTGRTESGAF